MFSPGERHNDDTYSICKTTRFRSINCYCSKSQPDSRSFAKKAWYGALHAFEQIRDRSTDLWTVSVWLILIIKFHKFKQLSKRYDSEGNTFPSLCAYICCVRFLKYCMFLGAASHGYLSQVEISKYVLKFMSLSERTMNSEKLFAHARSFISL